MRSRLLRAIIWKLHNDGNIIVKSFRLHSQDFSIHVKSDY